jgi:hypothetical protein
MCIAKSVLSAAVQLCTAAVEPILLTLVVVGYRGYINPTVPSKLLDIIVWIGYLPAIMQHKNVWTTVVHASENSPIKLW